MNNIKQYFVIVYKGGYIIPHCMIYCDSYTETENSLILRSGRSINKKMEIEILEYDYYHVYELENDNDVKTLVAEIVKFINKLEDNILIQMTENING